MSQNLTWNDDKLSWLSVIGKVTVTLLNLLKIIKTTEARVSTSENTRRYTLSSVHSMHTTISGVLFCPKKCMNNKEIEQILRLDLDQHLKNECPNRQYQCPHCKVTGRYCDITNTTHLGACRKVKVTCTNTGCKASVPHCELADHRSKCQFEKVPCKYAGSGCKEVSLRKDLK